MDNLIIRPSRDEDVPALHAIYAHSVATETASWEYEPPTLAEFAQRRQNILAQGFPYITAELDGRPVGYSYASSYRARIGYRFLVEDSVYVAQDAAGRGIGKTLMQTLIDECARLGFRQMIAVIGDSANIRSIKLHEACGFRHVATFNHIGWKFGRWLDSVQMQRALGEGASTLAG
ncbi:MAG: GNAT family N-acetyltransferase [Burkholderiales bacterium]|nr:GNAT family N-acetyltransferase [Burkholderiales bacterium]